MDLRCDNCGVIADFEEIGYDEVNNIILECQECGSVCYEDGSLVEDDIKINR